MSEAPGGPRLYLVTPSRPGLGRFPDLLGRLLDAHEIACVRLGVSGVDAEAVARAADTLRPVCHERDVPLVIAEHFRLVRPLGLDGVHLGDGSRNLRTARAEVGADGLDHLVLSLVDRARELLPAGAVLGALVLAFWFIAYRVLRSGWKLRA